MTRAFLRYLLRRAMLAAVLVFVASSAAFFLAHTAPGDAASAMQLTPDQLRAERHRLGLDRPILTQYFAWLSDTTHLDLGESSRYHRPVNTLVRERTANTMLLGATALLLATLIGIPAGILTGARHGGVLIGVIRGLSLVIVSIPPLVTSLALLLFAASTRVLPAGGLDTSSPLRSLVLPAVALALPIAAALEQLQSRALSDALTEPCIVAALARGVPRRRVIWRHGLKLAARPVAAIYGIMFGTVLSGSFAVEVILTWPGLGDLLYRAVQSRDINLIAGCAVAASVFLAVGVLLSDLAIAAADPRIEMMT